MSCFTMYKVPSLCYIELGEGGSLPARLSPCAGYHAAGVSAAVQPPLGAAGPRGPRRTPGPCGWAAHMHIYSRGTAAAQPRYSCGTAAVQPRYSCLCIFFIFAILFLYYLSKFESFVLNLQLIPGHVSAQFRLICRNA